jgi:hypothetical protein
MDAGGIGAVIGVSVIVGLGAIMYVYDRCRFKPKDDTAQVINPLLSRKKSFKVKNLFNHVQI